MVLPVILPSPFGTSDPTAAQDSYCAWRSKCGQRTDALFIDIDLLVADYTTQIWRIDAKQLCRFPFLAARLFEVVEDNLLSALPQCFIKLRNGTSRRRLLFQQCLRQILWQNQVARA